MSWSISIANLEKYVAGLQTKGVITKQDLKERLAKDKPNSTTFYVDAFLHELFPYFSTGSDFATESGKNAKGNLKDADKIDDILRKWTPWTGQAGTNNDIVSGYLTMGFSSSNEFIAHQSNVRIGSTNGFGQPFYHKWEDGTTMQLSLNLVNQVYKGASKLAGKKTTDPLTVRDLLKYASIVDTVYGESYKEMMRKYYDGPDSTSPQLKNLSTKQKKDMQLEIGNLKRQEEAATWIAMNINRLKGLGIDGPGSLSSESIKQSQIAAMFTKLGNPQVLTPKNNDKLNRSLGLDDPDDYQILTREKQFYTLKNQIYFTRGNATS